MQSLTISNMSRSETTKCQAFDGPTSASTSRSLALAQGMRDVQRERAPGVKDYVTVMTSTAWTASHGSRLLHACTMIRGWPPLGLPGGQPRAYLIERMLPIAGVGPDLTRPAAQFDGLGPRCTD